MHESDAITEEHLHLKLENTKKEMPKQRLKFGRLFHYHTAFRIDDSVLIETLS